MPPSRFVRCIAAPLLLLSGAAAGEDTLALQMTPMLAPQQARPDAQAPLFLSAERMAGTQDQEIEAFGNVELRRSGTVVATDYLRYRQNTDEVEARGNVRLQQQGLTLSGPALHLRLTDRVGNMEQPVYSLDIIQARELTGPVTVKARGQAAVINFEGEDRYRLNEASYTTCPLDSDDWYLRVRDLQIDRSRDVGIAQSAVLEFKGVPILYTPWMDFALDTRRKTGLLAPTIGTSGKNGVEILLPWYWNIAPNRDATFNPRVMSRRGLQLGGEFRYLEENYRGQLVGEFLPDQDTGTQRWGIFAKHQQNLAPGWSGSFVYERVSDDNYFRDLSNQIKSTSITNLPQEATLGYQAGWWSAGARVQRFQTLQDPRAPVVAPYNRLPQLTLKAERPVWRGADFGFSGELVRFDHPTLTTGTRVVAYPRVSLPLVNEFGYITPKFGVHQTNYYLNSPTLPDTSRTLPIVSVDSGVYLDRPWRVFGRDYQQTLEPRLYYVYIPHRDQSRIPNFDSAELDFNYAQMFTENRFSGSDRINDANQATLALTSRLIEPASGLERLRATIGQRFYFAPQNVVLPGGTPKDSKATDLLASIGGQITPAWRAEAAWQYDTDLGVNVRSAWSARYRPAPGKTLNFSYRTIRGSVEQLDVSAQWPLATRWYGLMRYNYSLKDGRLLEGLAGLEYNAGCWATRGVMQSIATAAGISSTSFFIQLELNGIGRFGANPLDVLKHSIPGYVISNELQSR